MTRASGHSIGLKLVVNKTLSSPKTPSSRDLWLRLGVLFMIFWVWLQLQSSYMTIHQLMVISVLSKYRCQPAMPKVRYSELDRPERWILVIGGLGTVIGASPESLGFGSR